MNQNSQYCFDQKLENRLTYLILMSFLSFSDNLLHDVYRISNFKRVLINLRKSTKYAHFGSGVQYPLKERSVFVKTDQVCHGSSTFYLATS